MNYRYSYILLIVIGFLLTKGANAQDSILHYPISDKGSYPFSISGFTSPLYLQNPANIKSQVVFDPLTRKYVFTDLSNS